MVLGDAEGLVLASSSATEDADRLAAAAAACSSLAERYAQLGIPVPQTFVAQDRVRRAVVHRMFSVHGERYVLSVVTFGPPPAPQTLEVALAALEPILERERWCT